MKRNTTKKKLKKNANGEGCITKLSGNRSKPWVFKFTQGIVDGKQVIKAITFETRKEAEDAQRMYVLWKNKKVAEENLKRLNEDLFMDIYNKQTQCLSFGDIFDILMEEEWKYNYSKSRIASFNTCRRLFEPIYDMKINMINVNDYQKIIDKIKIEGYSVGYLNIVKTLIRKVQKYAINKGYIDVMTVERINVGKSRNDLLGEEKRASRQRTVNIFTADEIKKLWDMIDTEPMAKVCLVYIYTGMRKVEFYRLKDENIHDTYCIGGVKTKAGRDRIIPIHKDIRWVFNDAREYILKFTEESFCKQFAKFMNKLGWKHRNHDTRHTYTTIVTQQHMPFEVRERILGHEVGNITDDVYSHLTVEYLASENDKICFLPFPTNNN